MFGTNRAEPWLREHTGKELDVQEVFRTVQGEGPYAGLDAVFIRLAGCHLRCHFCDTDFTSLRHMVPVVELVERAVRCGLDTQLFVLTGGEPMRQNIVPLCFHLTSRPMVRADYRHVQVETAGSFWPHDARDGALLKDMVTSGLVSLVVSPKTATVHEAVRDYAMAWKYVVGADTAVGDDGLPLSCTQRPGARATLARPPYFIRPDCVYLQPRDDGNEEANRANRAACVRLVQAHGYRLSLQQHKILEMP